MRSGEYYSKGKFLLSGEYFVLYGAKALAVPLKFGQEMQVREIPRAGVLEWETYVMDKPWFKASFRLDDMAILDSSSHKTAVFIRNLLRAGAELQPALKLTSQGFSINNHLDFDIRWGLGSSSSLVSNLAYWLEIDPYSLYRSTFQGSGYDVFCARADGPITFQLKHGKLVKFSKCLSIRHLLIIYISFIQDVNRIPRKVWRKFKSKPHQRG